MANVYCISYDLNRAGQDYSGLYQKIKECGTWWHYLDSTWLLSSSKTAQQIYNHVKGSIDNNDRILIIKVTNEYQGYLTKEAWEWIRKHVTS